MIFTLLKVLSFMCMCLSVRKTIHSNYSKYKILVDRRQSGYSKNTDTQTGLLHWYDRAQQWLPGEFQSEN